jgi:hypothetical protein
MNVVNGALNGKYAKLKRTVLAVLLGAILLSPFAFVGKKAISSASRADVQKVEIKHDTENKEMESRLDAVETEDAVMNVKLDYIIERVDKNGRLLEEHVADNK